MIVDILEVGFCALFPCSMISHLPYELVKTLKALFTEAELQKAKQLAEGLFEILILIVINLQIY